MKSANYIFWNPSEIRIPPHTLIALCGISNSGKTTFANRHFNKEIIINTDEILEETISTILQITERDLSITSESKVWEEISQHLARIALLKAQESGNNLLISSSQKNSVTVFDSVHLYYEERMDFISKFQTYFKHVYLFVIHPELNEIMSREPKDISDNSKSLGFYYPDSESAPYEHYLLENQISNESIAHMVEKTFIFTELESDIDITFA
jgi:septin family protein